MWGMLLILEGTIGITGSNPMQLAATGALGYNFLPHANSKTLCTMFQFYSNAVCFAVYLLQFYLYFFLFLFFLLEMRHSEQFC